MSDIEKIPTVCKLENVHTILDLIRNIKNVFKSLDEIKDEARDKKEILSAVLSVVIVSEIKKIAPNNYPDQLRLYHDMENKIFHRLSIDENNFADM